MAYLIIGVIAGTICALVASSKGRNAVGWFFLGFFFPLIGIIVICCVSNLKEERARYQRSLNERRRLREELRIEKIKAQQFRGQAEQRLDIHDRALGVDTRTSGAAGALPQGAQGQIPAPPPGPSRNSAQWYYSSGGSAQQGPVTLQGLAGIYHDGRLRGTDLVWREGWKDWRRIADVPGLEQKLGS